MGVNFAQLLKYEHTLFLKVFRLVKMDKMLDRLSPDLCVHHVIISWS